MVLPLTHRVTLLVLTPTFTLTKPEPSSNANLNDNPNSFTLILILTMSLLSHFRSILLHIIMTDIPLTLGGLSVNYYVFGNNVRDSHVRSVEYNQYHYHKAR